MHKHYALGKRISWLYTFSFIKPLLFCLVGIFLFKILKNKNVLLLLLRILTAQERMESLQGACVSLQRHPQSYECVQPAAASLQGLQVLLVSLLIPQNHSNIQVGKHL